MTHPKPLQTPPGGYPYPYLPYPYYYPYGYPRVPYPPYPSYPSPWLVPFVPPNGQQHHHQQHQQQQQPQPPKQQLDKNGKIPDKASPTHNGIVNHREAPQHHESNTDPPKAVAIGVGSMRETHPTKTTTKHPRSNCFQCETNSSSMDQTTIVVSAATLPSISKANTCHGPKLVPTKQNTEGSFHQIFRTQMPHAKATTMVPAKAIGSHPEALEPPESHPTATKYREHPYLALLRQAKSPTIVHDTTIDNKEILEIAEVPSQDLDTARKDSMSPTHTMRKCRHVAMVESKFEAWRGQWNRRGGMRRPFSANTWQELYQAWQSTSTRHDQTRSMYLFLVQFCTERGLYIPSLSTVRHEFHALQLVPRRQRRRRMNTSAWMELFDLWNNPEQILSIRLLLIQFCSERNLLIPSVPNVQRTFNAIIRNKQRRATDDGIADSGIHSHSIGPAILKRTQRPTITTQRQPNAPNSNMDFAGTVQCHLGCPETTRSICIQIVDGLQRARPESMVKHCAMEAAIMALQTYPKDERMVLVVCRILQILVKSHCGLDRTKNLILNSKDAFLEKLLRTTKDFPHNGRLVRCVCDIISGLLDSSHTDDPITDVMASLLLQAGGCSVILAILRNKTHVRDATIMLAACRALHQLSKCKRVVRVMADSPSYAIALWNVLGIYKQNVALAAMACDTLFRLVKADGERLAVTTALLGMVTDLTVVELPLKDAHCAILVGFARPTYYWFVKRGDLDLREERDCNHLNNLRIAATSIAATLSPKQAGLAKWIFSTVMAATVSK